MRNIEASAWLSNPELQLVETKGISAVATGGAEFVLTVQQKGPDPEAEIRALTPGAKGRLRRPTAGNGGAP